jgi:hypothetical protein
MRAPAMVAEDVGGCFYDLVKLRTVDIQVDMPF